MDYLQEEMQRSLDELAHRVLAELIDEKLRTQNIKLPKRHLKALTAHVLQANAEVLTIDDGKPDKDVTISFSHEDLENFDHCLDKLVDKIPAITKVFLEETSVKVLALLKRRWRSEGRQQRKEMEGFRKRLNQRWGPGLEGLRLLTTMAREFGSDLGHKPQELEATRTLDVLRRLHARACQITEEIIALLSHGFQRHDSGH